MKGGAMRGSIVAVIILLAGCGAPPPPIPAAPITPPNAIQSSIQRLTDDLLACESDQLIHAPPLNNAPEMRRQALVIYALLSAGISPDQPILAPVLTFLKNYPNPDPYTRGLRLQILELQWMQLHDPAIQNLAIADAAALLQSLHVAGPLIGRWSDHDDPAGPFAEAADPAEVAADDRATESAVAGLSAVQQMGGQIPDKVWALVQARIRNDQYPDGGWGDVNPPMVGRFVTAENTLANLHALQIIRGNFSGNVGCRGNVADDSIENAEDWVGMHFDEITTPQEYWTIAQIAGIGGNRYFGRIDWFHSIAPRILSRAGPGEHGEIDPIIYESQCLLFLVFGSAPVAITKLDYESGRHHSGNWNERPSDVLNFTRWAGNEMEARLNWQVASLSMPLEALQDSPILYLAGDGVLRLTDADVDKIRQFVLQGGLILGNADCGSVVFKNSFVRLGQKMFPLYEFRELGKDDLLFTGEPFRKFRGSPKVLALSNGVRDLMLLLPTGDPAWAWQANSFLLNPDQFGIGADIFGYATDGGGFRNKNNTYVVRPDPTVTPTRTIRLARLMVGDNPDPEPAGWERLAAILHNQPYRIDLRVCPVNPGDSLAGFQIVHLAGTTAFKFTPAERRALIDFTHRGGTLIIDAAGGSQAFADAAENELHNMFGNALAWLPPNDPVYNLPGSPIAQVRYRRFAMLTLVGSMRTPHIQAAKLGNRTTVFFSPFDLSAGLVGEQIDGINGYSPDSATALMRNIILSCLN
jgi:hypothetical protein